MADVSLSKWIYKLGNRLPYCPNPLIRSEVLDTIREFCQRTKLWTEQLTAIDVVSDTARYALSSDNGEVFGVQRAELDEEPLSWTDVETKDRDDDTDWRTDTTDDPTECWYDETTGELVLVLTPSADHDVADDGGLVVWAYLMPALTATEVPDWIYNKYSQEIEEGALARLLDMESVPWTDPAKAQLHKERFDAMVGPREQSVKTRRHQGRTAARVRDVLRARSNIDF